MIIPPLIKKQFRFVNYCKCKPSKLLPTWSTYLRITLPYCAFTFTMLVFITRAQLVEQSFTLRHQICLTVFQQQRDSSLFVETWRMRNIWKIQAISTLRSVYNVNEQIHKLKWTNTCLQIHVRHWMITYMCNQCLLAISTEWGLLPSS